MKLVTKLTVAATLATFMFAGVNLTWGNTFTNGIDTDADTVVDADGISSANSFGVWIDVNDSMAFGWEGTGLKAGFDGPAGMQMRLGFDPTDAGADIATTLGMSRSWWTSTGDGWATNLSTALDWGVSGVGEGDFTLTMNLGFGY